MSAPKRAKSVKLPNAKPKKTKQPELKAATIKQTTPSKYIDILNPSDVNKLANEYAYKPATKREFVYLSDINRKTSEVMTDFEYADVISIRAQQLTNGGICFTNVDGIDDCILMAEKEVKDKCCPLSIIRMHTDTMGEKWDVNEMTHNDI